MPPDGDGGDPTRPCRPVNDLLRPAAFLDRDGVLNIDRGFTHRVADLMLTPTAAEAVGLLNAGGYVVVVVTNQSGVARGYFDTQDVETFHAALADRLGKQGARIDAFYYCPFHPDGVRPGFAMEHEDRKPGAGMLLRAMSDLGIDPDRSFMIGDSARDDEAAARAGIRALIVPSNEACDLAAAVRTMIATEA